MAEQEIPTGAFILSLVGGILVLLMGIMFLTIGTAFMGGTMGGYYPGMMGGYYYPGGAGLVSSIIAGIGIWGLICGVLILLGAFMIYTRPGSHGIWGIIILIFSLLSFIAGGGFIIGAILGVIGGILAIVWKPPESKAEAEKTA
jgi:hypothetical protein